MILYIETSAAAKLLIDEPASSRLAARLDDAVDSDDALLSTMLLETELRRLAVRVDLAQTAVTRLRERFDLVETDRSLYRETVCFRAVTCTASTRCTSRPRRHNQHADGRSGPQFGPNSARWTARDRNSAPNGGGEEVLLRP